MGSSYRWNSCSEDQQPNQTDRERRRPDKTEQVNLSTKQTFILHFRTWDWGRDRRQSSSSTTQIFQIQGVTKTLLK